ncbi:Mut7-C ubiquitin/RNAse domain-containing protein [Streptomyces lunaelactis]|uniref:Mut7-C RNAse domain-containing protein n=1 Tax=Streptomyces lunaelactis TaxID=1535768 RepID=UPI001585C284|nr:Mut7-C RNAse domain-containing protein [Streptomyces lunaelactis]NUK04845.1 Mut7-C ubiquitin/RNAse domain-containing protein [Streptomyces lunaelactis]NUK19341.1 Mut7-C ubiquitin/RNAse domain-containing protein [Streptomyces lunaelactis]NUK37035.1 Mut7-C ubiquitin/RNAse domain-containing protein [Streptomyces lunaelactis]NUK43048.1 Mut7-C ubiquitin/RNAse domain-containing protein [Streptomyces lunaelactis]NUK60357.1 Mut7-C ubiquitin/RNAse domain-containing protein [Streptomyces lunaelactis]
MNGPEIHLSVAPELRLFVPSERRQGRTTLVTDGSSTLGHVIESLGIPLTEAGRVLVDGRQVAVSHIPRAGERVEVNSVERPQQVPGAPLRFLLDVHLGTLARRLRLLGVDAAYENEDIGDPALATLSAKEQRVLLSRDRGLLRRREIWAGAYIYSDRPDDQLRDVLERFAPVLAPWTRCTACNGSLSVADKDSVQDQLQQGTQRSYDVFAQCTACERVYWRGAHHARLEAIVEEALREFGGAAA